MNSLSSMAVIVTERLTGVMAFEDYDLARVVIGSFQQNENILTACLYDDKTELVTQYNKSGRDVTYCLKNRHIAAPLMVDQTISLDGQTYGNLLLYADPRLIWNHLLSMSAFVLLIATLCYVLTRILSKRYFKQETESLFHLASTAREISKTGEYDIRVSTGDNPAMEISNLVNSFNELLEIVENHRDHLEEMISIRTAQLNEEKTKVEKISEAKSEFLAKLSHDIRTPLTSILGFSEMINNNAAISDKHRHYINTIIKNADFISELVNGLLVLSKLESTGLSVKSEPFDMNKILILLKQTFEPIAENKNLKLEFNTLSIERNWLWGDSLKLQQALNNLLENAIKYTSEGHIEFTTLQTQEDEKSVRLLINITDTGIGISDEKINLIFEEYIKIGSGIKPETGTGLGLAIARKLIEAMDGTIKVSSTPSEGSTFTIDVPFKLASARQNDFVQANSDTGPIRQFLLMHSPVMVIDDDPDFMEIITEIILSLETTVRIIQAECCEQARTLFDQHRPGLVFTDIELPDGDGYKLSKIFKQKHAGTVIVAVSAYHSSDEYVHTNDVHFDDFIAKPFHRDNIADTLHELAKSQKQY